MTLTGIAGGWGKEAFSTYPSPPPIITVQTRMAGLVLAKRMDGAVWEGAAQLCNSGVSSRPHSVLLV